MTDTSCVHACSRFYETDSAIKIGMMEAFKKLAVDPDSLPDIIFASIGRTTWKVCGPDYCTGRDTVTGRGSGNGKGRPSSICPAGKDRSSSICPAGHCTTAG